MIVLDGEEYLTVDEAARLLGVKRATLYAYVSRGVLRSYRQGIKRQRLYRRAEVEDLIRIAPSAPSGDAAGAEPQRERRRPIQEIPLAESWIRD
ncbi:MAG: helix-turn-helix domain-containing protein [Candidatus Rokubacteria bacterium]|nr:helix-turn-helix domain-containing protein [Candidatus Rokubacteria bacterium]